MSVHPRNVYTSYLRLLVKLIVKLEEQAGGDNSFLDARLSPDMFPLKVQAKVAASFALRACAPGIITEISDPGSKIDTPYGLISYISEVAEFVENSELLSTEKVEDRAGLKDICMGNEDYVNLFSLPNFFFHLSMIYAIAKNQGFCVTKGDFDGIHEYPKGFSWEG